MNQHEIISCEFMSWFAKGINVTLMENDRHQGSIVGLQKGHPFSGLRATTVTRFHRFEVPLVHASTITLHGVLQANWMGLVLKKHNISQLFSCLAISLGSKHGIGRCCVRDKREDLGTVEFGSVMNLSEPLLLPN